MQREGGCWGVTGISPWVSVFGTLGAGAVVGALANYALRVWTEKKQKHQERKSLLFLVLLEIFTNETTAKRWKKRLEEDKMRGKSASDEPPTLKIDIWENARTRLAYLVPTEHFYPIIRYYDAVSRWKITSEEAALNYFRKGLLPRSKKAAKVIGTEYLEEEMSKGYIQAYEKEFKQLPDTWWQRWYGPGGYSEVEDRGEDH
jgi:hypothetical protein